VWLRKNYLIITVIFIALFLRSYQITNNPPSLNWDEVSHGFNAYSILKTGKDEWGNTLPLIFRAYGDYKLPVYIYLTTLSEMLFGVNTFAVRFTSLIAGVLTVLFAYLLSEKLFKNKSVALIAALLVGVEPWSLFLSRGGFEANLALAFITAGTYFFIHSFDKAKLLFISAILFGLSVWTYNSARVFVPLLLMVLIWLYRKELRLIWVKYKTISLSSLFIILFLFIPMFWQLVNPVGQARYGEVSIIDAGAVGQIINLRNKSNLPQTVKRILYNRPVYFTASFMRNWAEHYSGDFLFFKGGSNYQFSIPGFGLIYPLNIIFLIIGLFSLVRNRSKESLTVLTFFFLGSIPSSLTREAPQVLRAITMLPSPMIIIAIGFVAVYQWLDKRLKTSHFPWVVLYLILLTLFAVRYLSSYFGEYRTNYSWSWQYGYSNVISYAKENYNKYDKIIVTKKYGEPHEFFLFAWPWNPEKYRNDSNLIRFYQSNWYWVDRFDKFYFVNDWDIPKEEWQKFKLESGTEFGCDGNEKCLLITSPGNYPKGWSKLETVDFLGGKVAFEILEI
jgi:4-amino-4-deoxy-L-arabinose transferase-like glycosyltransferase